MKELISVKQDNQGTRYLMAGSFSLCHESWHNIKGFKSDLIKQKQKPHKVEPTSFL